MHGLDQMKVVLVQTSHGGNIGAAARAMKTMGLSRLVLVSPKRFPTEEAIARAAGADDLLAQAQVVDTLNEAIADCAFVVAASARTRTVDWPLLNPREAAEQLVQESLSHPVAYVFGNERVGLSNQQLQQAHVHMQIPANKAYSSLNLAAAVQVACYELRMAQLGLQSGEAEKKSVVYPSAERLTLFYEHLRACLIGIDFLDPETPKHVLPKLKRLFARARLEENELNILRGILTAIDKRVVE
jgi:tRNA (cytidine32/uridine32-2'-O)-methyltransferase